MASGEGSRTGNGKAVIPIKHFREMAPGVWHAYRPTSVVNPTCAQCGDYDRGGGRRGWRWRWTEDGQGGRFTEAICGRCYERSELAVLRAPAV